ncbi:MAG: hypothetical protein Q9163_003141 [Psora crenata]
MSPQMACLGGLSVELQYTLISYLDQKALISWSRTCSSYRALIAPYMFRVIALRNTEKSASSVDTIAHNSQFAAYVKELNYTAEAPWDSGFYQDADERPPIDISPFFPEIVSKVLSSLGRFPNLKVIRLDLSFTSNTRELGKEPFWNASDETGTNYFFEDAEPPQIVRRAEEIQAWRALMARTYAALSENLHSTTIEALEIYQLPAREVSTFHSSGWHQFLGMLKRFYLSVQGSTASDYNTINTQGNYIGVLSKLDEFFFNHLTNVTHFTLEADHGAPIGLGLTLMHSRLGLQSQQMPLIRSVRLQYIIICEELVEFLCQHAGTLETLIMHNCFAEIGGLVEPHEVYWHKLFSSLHDAKPRALRQVEILPARIELTMKDHIRSKEEQLRQVTESLKNDPSARNFAYVELDDKYGYQRKDDNQMVLSCLDGKDLKAYSDLMQLVRENKATLDTSSLV